VAVTYSNLQRSLLQETAALHVQNMPIDMASQIGVGFVRDIFHAGSLSYSGGITHVAKVDGQVAGFCFAHIDFHQFGKFQRTAHRWLFYRRLLAGLLRKPQLFMQLFSAQSYLSLKPEFVNLGPLLVAPQFRTVQSGTNERTSLATELTRRTFEDIARRAPAMPVRTMIRSSNMGSIAAVAQGARLAGFVLTNKFAIDFDTDRRIVFEYRSNDGHE